MLVYHVYWSRQDELAKTSKRGPRKTVGAFYSASILCRNLKEAMSAFEWCFNHYFDVDEGLTIIDGKLEFKRQVIDSRGFNVQFLYFDSMKHPLYLTDIEHSLLCYNNVMH